MAQAVIGPVSRWHDSGIVGVGPGLWYGPTALDGAAGDWKRAPLGSIYVQVDAAGTGTSTWQKVAKAGATADWKKIAVNAATDTLTAGVIKPAADSTASIQLQKATGTPVVTVDTTNSILIVGLHSGGSASPKALSLENAYLNKTLATAHGEVKFTIYDEVSSVHGLVPCMSGMQYYAGSSADHIFTINNDGTEALRIKTATGFVGLSNNDPKTRLDLGAGAITLLEMTAPGAGAANTARIYAVDNGGKTEIVAQFATGAPIRLAIEV